MKPIVPAGSRGETHQSLSARDAGRSASYPFPHRAVLLMVEMGLYRLKFILVLSAIFCKTHCDTQTFDVYFSFNIS